MALPPTRHSEHLLIGRPMPVSAAFRVLRHCIAARRLAALLLPFLLPVPVSAQPTMMLGGDAVARSTYVWRGITRSSGWVLQPDAYLSAEFPGMSVTAGWWGTIELSTADPRDPSAIGLGNGWIDENNLWLEVAGRTGPLFLSGGFTAYRFAGGAFGQSGSVQNTAEVYASGALDIGPLIPRAAVWYDIDRVRGAYVEAGADLGVPVLPTYDPIVALYLSALTGWSFGQETDPERPEEPAYFAAGGLTHLDLGLTAMVGKDRSYVTFELHFLLAEDDGAGASPVTGPVGGASWWLGVGFSDSLVLGGLVW